MQLTLSPETSAALTADKTIRCVVDMRYPLPSRQSSAAIAFARQFTEELARSVPARFSLPRVFSPTTANMDATPSTSNLTTTDAQLHGVLLERNRLRVCFHLFLDDCEPKVRREAGESRERPIHVVVIHKSGNGYRIRRSPMLDMQIARRYASFREMDMGAKPYFADSSNSSPYVGAIRFDGSLEEFHVGSEALFEEGEEWEPEEVCGHRTASDGFLELLIKWKSGREPTWELFEDVARTGWGVLDEYQRLLGKDNVNA